MEIVYTVFWFIIGICFGSFFHVVGYRLPKGESLIYPKRSYCPDCGHELAKIDLIPIFSFLFGKGKCRYCKKKISWFYPMVELITGLLFAVSFHLFGYSYEFFISLVLSSLFSIILVSDTLYLIISDEVLIAGSILFILISFLFQGFSFTILHIGYGILMFLAMYLLMLFGNFVFKKESLGGADIKLMFLSGFVLDPFLSLCVIFLSSVLALPVALILYIVNQEKMIPYGPFLMLAILGLFLAQIDIDSILKAITFMAL